MATSPAKSTVPAASAAERGYPDYAEARRQRQKT
jgi:hypothetical protein